ncbi:MAG: hypothetical protein ABSC08_19440, partial [Bryobacteraceae bacterium]
NRVAARGEFALDLKAELPRAAEDDCFPAHIALELYRIGKRNWHPPGGVLFLPSGKSPGEPPFGLKTDRKSGPNGVRADFQ